MDREPSYDPSVEPDTKDWTWVLRQPCLECGFEAETVRRAEVAKRVLANATAWRHVLDGPTVAQRPAPGVWSPLEYACHVRDVHEVFADRVRSMLAEHDPSFANWDQDEAAVVGAYREQDPVAVTGQLADAANEVAALYAAVEGDQWERSGRRSNGSVFTTDSLARYHLHDVEHHLFDVSR